MNHEAIVTWLAACRRQPPCHFVLGGRTRCTCLPGTAGWHQHHPPTYGTLPEAFDLAMASFADDDPDDVPPGADAASHPRARRAAAARTRGKA